MKKSGFVDYVLDQLRGLSGVTARAMFGGHGLYKDGIFFAAVAEERLFFRVSDATRPRYEEAGMPPFAPYGMKPMRSYYEVPADVLESPPQIIEWARGALADAKAAKLIGRTRGRKRVTAGRSSKTPNPKGALRRSTADGPDGRPGRRP